MLPGPLELLVVALETTTIVIGTPIVRYAHAAHTRTGEVTLPASSGGFGIVTPGTSGGVVDLLPPPSELLAVLTTSTFLTLGLVTVLYAFRSG